MTPTIRSPRATTASSRLPALDGLRGFALIGMLAWHAELTWVRGGFARMTIFFVLAGFLAALSLARARQVGRGFLTFWGRRARRLLPMTLVGVGFAIGVTGLVGGSHARQAVTGDALATLASVANWRFVLSDQPYGALFESGSAFQHYWSLSLEEQAFVVLPAILALVAWTSRGRHVARLALLGGLALFCGLLPAFVTMATDTAYYGTHVRLGEFLAGVLLAEVVVKLDPAEIGGRARRVVGGFGGLGLAVLVITMVTIDREQTWLYEGGLLLFAVPTVAVIAAAWIGSPAVTKVLALAPLAALGRWALSVYVLHWPLYQVLAHESLGLDGATLVVVQLSVAVVVGAVAYRYLEQPLLRVTRVGGPERSERRVAAAGSSLLLAVNRRPVLVLVPVLVILVVSTSLVPSADPLIDFDEAEASMDAVSLDEAVALLDERNPVQIPLARDGSLVGVALFGGSGALMLGMGEWAWSEQHDGVESVHGYSGLGCGLTTGGQHRAIGTPAASGSFATPPEQCRDWDLTWPATVVRNAVDVAVVDASTWDLSEWRFDGGPVVSIGVDWFDELLLERMALAADRLHEAGAPEVVFLTPLPPPPRGTPAERDRMRFAGFAYREMLEEMARERPFVHIVDFGGWIESLEPAEVARLLPDGIHATPDTATEIWTRFLGPELERRTATVPRRP